VLITSKRYTGYTLAEILITLSIVGVVAALTIPALIKNFEEMQNRIAWKKAFSMISQASLAIYADHGGDLSELWDARGEWSSNEIRTEYGKHLGYIRICNNNIEHTEANCFPEHQYMNPGRGTRGCCSIGSGYFSAAVLKNGMAINIGDPGSCAGGEPYFTALSGHSGSCITMHVDTNGMKGPNVYGKDAFVIRIDATGRVYPAGIGMSDTFLASSTDWGCNPKGRGYFCALLYLKE